MPPIPPIPEESRAAIVSLAQAANVMRSMFHLAAEGSEDGELMMRHGATISLASAVIDAWRTALGLDLADDVAGTA